MFLKVEVGRNQDGYAIAIDGEIMSECKMEGGIHINLPVPDLKTYEVRFIASDLVTTAPADDISEEVFDPVDLAGYEVKIETGDEESEPEVDDDHDEPGDDPEPKEDDPVCDDEDDEPSGEEPERSDTTEVRYKLGMSVKDKIKESKKVAKLSVNKITELVSMKTGIKKATLSSMIYSGVTVPVRVAKELGKVLCCEIDMVEDSISGECFWQIVKDTIQLNKNADGQDAKRYFGETIVDSLNDFVASSDLNKNGIQQLIADDLGLSIHAVKGMFTRHAKVDEDIAKQVADFLGIKIVVGDEILNNVNCWCLEGAESRKSEEANSEIKGRAVLGADVKEIIDIYIKTEKIGKVILSHKVATAANLSQPAVYQMLFDGVSAPENLITALGEILDIEIHWSDEDDINFWRTDQKIS
jgi:cyanate lyase